MQVIAVNFFASAQHVDLENPMNAPLKIAFFAAVSSLMVICAPPGAPYYRTHNGALMGATAGAVIGHQLDHRNGAVAGGLAGALIGGTIGNQMDNQDYQNNDPYWRNRPPPRRYRYYRDDGPPPGYYDPY